MTKIVQEIASGMHDTRPKLLKLLTDPQIGKIVVEQRDRLTRYGFLYIEQLFAMQGRYLEVLFPSDTKHDLVADFIAVMTSMASRMDRGHYDCTVDADDDMRDLQQEAERNGYMLDWSFDQEQNDCAYVCN